jgi:hypothetical protein
MTVPRCGIYQYTLISPTSRAYLPPTAGALDHNRCSHRRLRGICESRNHLGRRVLVVFCFGRTCVTTIIAGEVLIEFVCKPGLGDQCTFNRPVVGPVSYRLGGHLDSYTVESSRGKVHVITARVQLRGVLNLSPWPGR